MQKRFLIHKLIILSVLIILGSLSFAAPVVAPTQPQQEHFYLDKAQLVGQQIASLRQRLAQANQELDYLQRQQKANFLSNDQASKLVLSKIYLQLESTKASLDGTSIELSHSQQAMNWLEKNVQEIENQLNALNIFGIRLVRENPVQAQNLRSELKYQENLAQLEKARTGYLLDLQKVETRIFQLYRERYFRVNALLKSRKMLHIKERQVKSEQEFQEQQTFWQQQLDSLYAKMRSASKEQYPRLEAAVFYANENVHLIYFKTLLRRYQDQIGQMQFSALHTSSISALNALSDQAQSLGKQISRLNALLNDRMDIIKKRGAIDLDEKQDQVANHFESMRKDIALLNERLSSLRTVLDRSIQHELSARQGLPGFSAQAWLDLGKEAVLLPALSYKLIKGFLATFFKSLQQLTMVQWSLFLVVEGFVVMAFTSSRKMLIQFLGRSLERGNLFFTIQYCLASFLRRNGLPLLMIANLWALFCYLSVPERQYQWLLELSGVWLVFRVIGIIARTGLVETVHDDRGHDVKLYHHLRAIFSFGALITSIMVLLHQLPAVYEMVDLFDRLFLLLLLLVSILVLRFWRVVPELVLAYIEPHRTYLRRIIYFMGFFAPSLLFVNSLVGLFGFLNLVWMMVWYEGIFTAMLVAYFLSRGLLHDGMEAISNLMISHVSNGWLWTAAFLKPLHSLLQLFLFIGAWILLFVFYGWDQQSPVVERLNNFMGYPLAHVLNTTITALSILKLVFAVSLFYWAARWTREFMFRLLFSKTQDLGIRNSMAILSQYAVVILGVLVCLKLVGIDLHALFLVASGLLIAISFGLRDLVNNFACGLLLLFERPIRVGDIVCVNDQEGRVTHIGSRAVTIRTWDHMEVSVPNTELFNKPFINWTVKDDIVRTVITLKLDRRDNPHEVRTIIEGVLKAHKDVLVSPAPEIFMKEMQDAISEFEVRYYIDLSQVASRVSVRSAVLYALWSAFDQHGIKAPNLLHEILVRDKA